MPTRRVAVRHPRAEAVHRSRQDRPALLELTEHSEAGNVLIISLIRAQLGLAFAVLALFVIIFGTLGVVLVTTSGFEGRDLFGVPLTWILLGPPSYAVIAALGWLFRRQADRNEQHFMDIVERD
jgi:hypothetical protein